mmetsp:Transcript_65972/g.97702  ORF Transcript_65972/g.97702 Transcript_65972/m.97702 type:complete len:94 (-) Transcript_65972:124-405(-)
MLYIITVDTVQPLVAAMTCVLLIMPITVQAVPQMLAMFMSVPRGKLQLLFLLVAVISRQQKWRYFALSDMEFFICFDNEDILHDAEMVWLYVV